MRILLVLLMLFGGAATVQAQGVPVLWCSEEARCGVRFQLPTITSPDLPIVLVEIYWTPETKSFWSTPQITFPASGEGFQNPFEFIRYFVERGDQPIRPIAFGRNRLAMKTVNTLGDKSILSNFFLFDFGTGPRPVPVDPPEPGIVLPPTGVHGVPSP